MKTYQMLINGQWQLSSSGLTLSSYNPSTEEEFCQIQNAESEDVDKAVMAAYNCFHSNEWKSLTYKDRSDLLREIACLIDDNASNLAKLETIENGKPIKESSLIDIPSAADAFRTFASLLFGLKGETFPCDSQTFAYTIYEPMGVVAQIIPWNYPLLIASWKLAAPLAAGNTVVIKPSEYTSATLLELGELLANSSLPKGAVNIITGEGKTVGKMLVEHPKVSMVSFTGSSHTAKSIINSTKEKPIPAVLELGGK